MSSNADSTGGRACWFVGATYSGTDDQMPRFIEEGIWVNGYKDKYLDLVKSIKPGDRIAIKSSYTRKRGLPFDNRGHAVSVMAIKAIGKVRENVGDGRNLIVEWTPLDSPREWYFYTNRNTIWRVLPGDWCTDGLINFAFDNVDQDIDRFRNAPYWRERYGDGKVDQERFHWTRFFEAIADKLLTYRDKRPLLVAKLHELAGEIDGLSILNDQKQKGVKCPMEDICPFTAIGLFNRGITNDNRMIMATKLAGILGVEEPVPSSFDGIPVVNNQNSWLFGYAYKRQPDDIDVLWEVFARALAFADSDSPDARSAFMDAYNNAVGRYMVGWKLTMGLYWIRPWNFPTLDGQSQSYIKHKLNIEISMNGPKGRCDANDYLALLDTLEARFQEDAYPVHSFPELSLAAWLHKDVKGSAKSVVNEDVQDEDEVDEGASDEIVVPAPPIEPYCVDDILEDGCFFARGKVEAMIERLRSKKNLILQGPPGTGKTWLAKRLAMALVGQRDDSKIRAVQFHPNLSYEDFIRGWRPSGDGKLTLTDGPFMEMIKAAVRDSSSRYVVVIEEINRGNPAQILGEMLTLLEADKRTPNEALELSYKRDEGERIFIPDNLYVVGTMNIADRSLALVDLALRRRFAFIDLEPTLGEGWCDWVQSKCGVPVDILKEIERRINGLNDDIAQDTSLGAQFRLGHSYVTPPFNMPIRDAREWFRQVVNTEIGPLLDEYWYDAIDKAQEAKRRLLAGF